MTRMQVVCDGFRCDAVENAKQCRESATTIRRRIEEQGWVYDKMHARDYCPDCAEKRRAKRGHLSDLKPRG